MDRLVNWPAVCTVERGHNGSSRRCGWVIAACSVDGMPIGRIMARAGIVEGGRAASEARIHAAPTTHGGSVRQPPPQDRGNLAKDHGLMQIVELDGVTLSSLGVFKHLRRARTGEDRDEDLGRVLKIYAVDLPRRHQRHR